MADSDIASDCSVVSNKEEKVKWSDYRAYDKNQLEILIDCTNGFTFKMKKMILDYVFISNIVFSLDTKTDVKVLKL